MVTAATSWGELARLPDGSLDLVMGAALIARDEYPSLEPASMVHKLDELASPLVGAGLEVLSSIAQAQRLARHVFDELGFRGNEADYYDPKNSLLPDVLERKVGIPISLGLVYTEIARRADVEANGVCFPGHFLVRIERNTRAGEAPGAILIDPFYAGKTLAEEDLVRMLKRVSGDREGEDVLRPEHTAPASARAILVRMLVNLKSIHVSRGDDARALLMLDRIVSLTPSSAAALKGRAMLATKLGAHEVARADLSRALELEPDASDAPATREALMRLSKKRSSLN
jgi:regulator of sirC expression with transglutaminase-like and TPR domain